MSYRRASSRVLGSFWPGLRSLLTMPSRICVASCSRSGTSLLFESQICIDARACVAACVFAGLCVFARTLSSRQYILRKDAKARQDASLRCRKMLHVPVNTPVDRINHVLRFSNAVALAWISNHDRFDADISKRNVVLLG